MSIDAMKQALEALEWALDFIPPESETDCECPLCKAHDALTEAIEQAERVKRAEEAFAAASEEMKGEQAEKQEYFECPACGSEGARAFPQPEQDTARPIYVAEVTMPDPGVGYD
jgi:rubredoxin